MIGLYKSMLRRNHKYLPVLAIIVAVLAIPALAFAVPGSGNMVSLDSYNGQSITELYNIIAKICLAILLIVEGVLFYAIFKFRRRSEDEQPEAVHGNLRLEIGWTLAAIVIQVFIGFKTVDVMFEVETEPQGGSDIVVEAVAKQWDWYFRYPKQQWRGEEFGGFTTDDLVIPANTQVQLDVTSDDVLHAIFIPELGVKIDAVPGRYNYWWFTASGPRPKPNVDLPPRQDSQRGTKTTTRIDYLNFLRPVGEVRGPQTGETRRVDYLGSLEVPEVSPFDKYQAAEYVGMCAELCGKGHWDMYFRTVAMTPSSFKQWLVDREKASQSADADGAAIYANRCAQCHGDQGAGDGAMYPTLLGTKWTVEEDWKEDHIEVVLLGSNASSLEGPTEVKGQTYDGAAMPQHASLLNDAEVAAVVNHERVSWGNDGGTVTHEDVAEVRDRLGLDPKPVVQAGGVDPSELIEQGERLYSACATCHGEDGKGVGQVPSLVDSGAVTGSVVRFGETLLTAYNTPDHPGKHSPMGRSYSNRELAALMTYIRQAWGNDAPPLQPPEVKRARTKIMNGQ